MKKEQDPKPGDFSVRRVSDNVEQRELGLKEWITLYYLREDDLHKEDQEPLLRRYSSYKYGSALDIQFFAEKLTERVHVACFGSTEKSLDNWVIVTPPYSSIKPAVHPLARIVADELGVSQVDLHTKQHGDTTVPYARISTMEERLRARTVVETYIDEETAVAGKQVIVIDDMITTGSTVSYLSDILLQQYKAAHVAVFAVISFETQNPFLEEWINTYLIRMQDIASLVLILNQPETNINRHTVKSIFLEEEGVFNAVIGQLSHSTLKKLVGAATEYYSGSVHEDRVNYLRDLIS